MISSAPRLVLALAAALLLVACSDGGDESSASAADGDRSAGSEPATRENAGDAPRSAAGRGGPVRLIRLGSFESPTYLTAPRGDSRRFVVERAGTIRIVRGRRTLSEPFLDISSLVLTDGESGLLSMAFAPDYARSGRFYVYYVDREGFLVVAQYRRSASDPDRAAPGSARRVLRVEHRRGNHKGGQLQFGPDGKLYAAFGDGGAGGDPDENAQDLGELLGKMIRISPRPGGGYSVPRDNPFRGRAGARPEIYAYGLRNPYRFSFDRGSGALTIGDVGQDAVEEVDYVPGARGGGAPRGGYNFGWDVFEGRTRYEPGRAPGHVRPVITHTRDAGYCSVIGGYVARDRSLGRGWTGRYVYGDLCSPVLRTARLRRGTAPDRATRLRVPQLVSFGEDGRGRLYAISLDGPVYRIGRR